MPEQFASEEEAFYVASGRYYDAPTASIAYREAWSEAADLDDHGAYRLLQSFAVYSDAAGLVLDPSGCAERAQLTDAEYAAALELLAAEGYLSVAPAGDGMDLLVRLLIPGATGVMPAGSPSGFDFTGMPEVWERPVPTGVY